MDNILLDLYCGLSDEAFAYFFPGLGKPGTSRSRRKTLQPDMMAPRKKGLIHSFLSNKLYEADVCPEFVPDGRNAVVGDEERVQMLLAEIKALQEKYGVTIEEFEAVLKYTVKLSRLRITRQNIIILEDFDRQEVRMDPLSKTVFFFYLRHPEGVACRALSSHRQELMEIYGSVSGRSNVNAMAKSIEKLIDTTSNSINEKVSRANTAFTNVIDERIARFYHIDGEQGAVKSIALDRSLVIWE